MRGQERAMASGSLDRFSEGYCPLPHMRVPETRGKSKLRMAGNIQIQEEQRPFAAFFVYFAASGSASECQNRKVLMCT